MEHNFECHKHLVRKTYRVGQPGRPLHYPPLSSSSSQSDDLRLEFHWQIKHAYYNVPDEQPLMAQHIVTSQEPVGFASSPVDRIAFLNDHDYSRQLVGSLIASCNSRASDNAIDWIVSKAQTTFQNYPADGCKTVLVGLELIQFHICLESVLVRGVMEQSFGENGGMRPASKSSIESLENVDLDKYEINGDQSLSCVVCLDELGMSSKDKEVLRMPCSHMFHGECILTWLNNSHYCPICRFEMPIC